jgi:hypothetical protein
MTKSIRAPARLVVLIFFFFNVLPADDLACLS